MNDNPYAAPQAPTHTGPERIHFRAPIWMILAPLYFYVSSLIFPFGHYRGNGAIVSGFATQAMLLQLLNPLLVVNVLFCVTLWRIWRGDWWIARIVGTIALALAILILAIVKFDVTSTYLMGGWYWLVAHVLIVAFTFPLAMLVEKERRRQLHAGVPESAEARATLEET